MFVCVLALAGNTMAGRGLMNGYGAYASQADVRTILQLQYAEVIRDIHRQICTIGPARNPTLENALEEYQLRYRDLARRRYPLPSCEKTI